MRHEELLALGLFDRGSRLGDRIEMLLKRGRHFSPHASPARVVVIGVVLLGLVAAGSLAPRWIAFAQQPAFEVASIKRQSFNGQGFVGIRISGNRLTAEHQSLSGLVLYAYDVQDYQLSGGPAWVYASKLDDPDMYEITAKAEGESAPTQDQFRRMLQTLLAERFKLKLHGETKELPAYALVVLGSGPKFKETVVDPTAPKTYTNWKAGRTEMDYDAKSTSMATLAWMLKTQTGRPVLDKTGLIGNYDFDLRYASGDTPAPDSTAPSIFTAVQEQLGLKLESTRGPFETLVIDHADKPSEN